MDSLSKLSLDWTRGLNIVFTCPSEQYMQDPSCELLLSWNKSQMTQRWTNFFKKEKEMTKIPSYNENFRAH